MTARMSPRRSPQPRAGFTVVEVLVAVVVLSVAILGSVGAQVSARKLLRTSLETDAAITALESAAEVLLLEPRARVPDVHPEGVALVVGEFGLADLAVVPTYPNRVAGAPQPPALEIRLTATWTTFDRGRRTLSLATAKGP